MSKKSRPHDDAVVELLQEDPAFADEYGLMTEEGKISLANRCSFANRHPIKKDLLDRMSDLSIEGAALYKFGIDPGAIQNELEGAGHEDASIELPDGFQEELAVIKSAVRAGSIERAPFSGSDSSNPSDDTRILKESFFEWCEQQDSMAEIDQLNPPFTVATPATAPEEPATRQSGDNNKLPNTANLVYWRAILHSNIKKIDLHGKTNVREIIKYLRGLGDTRLPNRGKVVGARLKLPSPAR